MSGTMLEKYTGTSTNVTIPNNVTRIWESAFYGTSLTSVSIPDSVTSIGVRVFDNCTSLAEATIGRGVTFIGSEAFANCTRLTTMIIYSSIPENGFGFRALPGNLQGVYSVEGRGVYRKNGDEWEISGQGA